jgi:hypothetical protein
MKFLIFFEKFVYYNYTIPDRRREMRSFVIAVVAICLATALMGNAFAVGLYVVGKEDCDCSPLVAKGIVPDTVNKLTEALLFPQIAAVLDQIGQQVRAMLAGFGPTSAEAAEPPAMTEQTTDGKEKTEVEKTPAKEEKPAVEKPAKSKKPTAQLKGIQKKKKAKKKVKMPPRAM